MTSPPRVWQWILRRALSRDDGEAALGDLAEEFTLRVRDEGLAGARRWYRWQAIRTAGWAVWGRRPRPRDHRSPDRAGDPLMSQLRHDLRYALRSIRLRPAFTGFVTATLALGVASVTLVLSVLDGVVLNPFPFPEPDRLVGVGTAFPQIGRQLNFVEHMAPAEYEDIRTQSRTLTDVVAWDMGNRQLTVGETTENLFTGFWWGDAFRPLATPALHGRGFLPDEIERGERVAVISHRVWQGRFGGDPALVGGQVLVNGDPYTLVGVMPPRTALFGMDLWIPMGAGPEVFPRNRRQFQILARIAPGADIDAVNAELETLARRTESAYGQEFPEYAGWSLEARTWNAINVQGLERAAVIAVAAALFVLMLVCANVASLLLARSAARRREMAVRVALGAGRGRVVRQLLTESLVLAALGGAVGVALGAVAVGWTSDFIASSGAPVPGDAVLNARVLLWVLLVVTGAGLLFGAAPAVRASRADLQRTLQAEGSGTTGTGGKLRLQRALVAVEVALALVLLVGGGLLARSLLNLGAVDPGYDTEGLLTMRLTLARERYPQEAIEPFFQELTERIGALPGVSGAVAASQFPPGVFARNQFWIEGSEIREEGQSPVAYTTLAGPGFFDVMGIPILRGRAFDESDVADGPPVAVLNEAAANRYFPGVDPIGRRLKLGGPESQGPWFSVVGIARDTKNRGLAAPTQPEMYASTRQLPGAWNQLFVMVRGQGEARSHLAPVRDAIRSMDPEQPVYAIRTADEVFAQATTTERASALVLGVFAAFALLLASVGVYGVSAYAVHQRTREIGLRLALGAGQGRVRRLVVRQALLPVAGGALVGVVGALLIGRPMSGLLYGVGTSDPLTIAGVTLLLAGTAAVASYLPARRAAGLDPATTLREAPQG